MSDTSETPPEVELRRRPDLVRELVLWRRKSLNGVILFAATALWVLMEIYQYNFIVLFSWAAMAAVCCLFFWGSIHRLLKKEAPDLSELEISEETAMETAKMVIRRVEDDVRLMFRVGAEREWFVFGGVVVCLYLISEVARRVDFLTISYIGVVGGMIVPVVYMKNEQKIRELGNQVKMKSQRLYSMGEEKLQKAKDKFISGKQQKEIKEKKTE